MKQTKKRTIIYVATTVILLALISFTLYIKNVLDYKQAVNNISFKNLDITIIEDGTYIGECNVDFIYAKVEVDAVSGATNSSIVLKKAVENALTQISF